MGNQVDFFSPPSTLPAHAPIQRPEGQAGRGHISIAAGDTVPMPLPCVRSNSAGCGVSSQAPDAADIYAATTSPGRDRRWS